MPIYTYQCEDCNHIVEDFWDMSSKPDVLVCEQCGGNSYQIIVLGHGGVQDDNPKWIDNDVRACLGAPGVFTRTDYKKFLRDNPHIEPAC